MHPPPPPLRLVLNACYATERFWKLQAVIAIDVMIFISVQNIDYNKTIPYEWEPI